MKKIKLLLFVLFLSLFVSYPVYADGTSTYYIEADIQSNGDMNVKELKILDGEYNGISTTLRYMNNNLRTFTGVEEDFDGSSIYNATGIENIKVYDVKKTTTDFTLINRPNTEFNLVSYANKGDFGKYVKEDVSGGVDLLIYMPSSYNRASLVTYTLKDVVVIHNDIAEIAWDFIGSSYNEDIRNLKIVVNLPSNSDELRVFSHGPLNGENKITSQRSVELTYDYLYSGNAVDMRVVFDKDIVSGGKKFSYVDGFDKILSVEKTRAEKANAIREEARKEEARIQKMSNIYKIIACIWLIGLIILIYIMYTKHDKEYKANFDGKYYRDFPNNYGPEIVSYLMYKKINNESFGATVLELIRKKALKVEEITFTAPISKKEKKDYKLIKSEAKEEVTETENIILNLLLNIIGNGKEVSLNDVKKYSNNYEHARTFMEEYNSWKTKSEMKAIEEGIYEDKSNKKLLAVIYAVSIMIISFGFYLANIPLGIFGLVNLIAIGAIIYFGMIKKRSVKSNEDYAKWNGLKNFLLDFGNFNDKEIPEVYLWEKYLVYATVFGIADKVQEQMKIKLRDINYDTSTDFTFLYFNNWYFYHSLNSSLTNSIASAKNTITSHEIASSSNSSSGGFGGGSSFGGGGFGGGGSGGGRF